MIEVMLENIGTKIKDAREEQNMSQKDLGMSLGLTDKAISAYEACRTIPPLETLVRIAEELHKPLDYFIHNEPNSFRIETQLARIENSVSQFLIEITAIRKNLRSCNSNEAIEHPAEQKTREFEAQNPGEITIREDEDPSQSPS